MLRGALPGRNPRTCAFLARFVYALSTSFLTASAGTSTDSSTKTGEIFCTVTCMGSGEHTWHVPPVKGRDESSPFGSGLRIGPSDRAFVSGAGADASIVVVVVVGIELVDLVVEEHVAALEDSLLHQVFEREADLEARAENLPLEL